MYTIYGKPNCQYCEQAKMLLKMKGLDYIYTDITGDSEAFSYVKSTGYRTVPVITKSGNFIGGFQELKESLK